MSGATGRAGTTGGITLLHLTDFHFGQEVPATRWTRLLDALDDDLTYLTGGALPVDLIVLSGDVANRGTPDEFATANDHLERLIGRLPGDPRVIAVPGNHDLERPVGEPTAALAAAAPHAFAGGVDDALKAGKDTPFTAVPRRALRNYERWSEGPGLLLSADVRGCLPGEGRYRFERGGVALDVVGLNTTLAQLAHGDFHGKLHVSPAQVDALAGGGEPADALVVVTHQPLDWLTGSARAMVDELLMAGPSGAVVHLFGHMHERNLSALTANGVEHRLSVQGASFFGLEFYGEEERRTHGEEERRTHGYSLVQIDKQGDALVGRVAPRLASPLPTGAWEFDRDAGTGLALPKGQDFSEWIRLRTLRPRTPAPPGPAPLAGEVAAPGTDPESAALLREVARVLSSLAPLKGEASGWSDRRDEVEVLEATLSVVCGCIDPAFEPNRSERLLIGAAWLLGRALRRVSDAALPSFDEWRESKDWAREVASLSTSRERLFDRVGTLAEQDAHAVAGWLQAAAVANSDRSWRLPETVSLGAKVAGLVEARGEESDAVADALLRLSRQAAFGRVSDGVALERLLSAGMQAPTAGAAAEVVRATLVEGVVVLLEAMTYNPGLDGAEVVEQIGVVPEFVLGTALGELWGAEWAVGASGDPTLVALPSDPAVELSLLAMVERIRGIAKHLGDDEASAALSALIDRVRTAGVTPSASSGTVAYESPVPRLSMNTERVRELLMGEQLYGDARLALREVYQNALDACRYRERREQYLEQTGGASSSWTGRISLRLQAEDEDEGRPGIVECLDTGVGMGKDKLVNSFLRAGDRFVESPEFADELLRWRERDPSATFVPNSTFGIGVYSYFMIADRIDVFSRAQDEEGRLGPLLLLTLVGGSTIARVREAAEDVPELAGGGTLVRMYLRPAFASGARLTLRESIDQIVWYCPFELSIEEAGEVSERSARSLAGSARPGQAVAFDDGDCIAWWTHNESQLLADGIASPVGLMGLTATLHGEHKPVLRVDRNAVVDWDQGWLLKRLGECGPSLCSWAGLTLTWLWRVSEAYPILGTTLAAYVAEHRPVLPLGLSRAWEEEVDIRRVGCFPADRYLVPQLKDQLRYESAYPELPVPKAKQRDFPRYGGLEIQFPACLTAWRTGVWRRELPELFEDWTDRIFGLGFGKRRPVCVPGDPDRSLVPDPIDAALLASQPGGELGMWRDSDFGTESTVDLAALVWGAYRCGLTFGAAATRLMRFSEVGLTELPLVKPELRERGPTPDEVKAIGSLGPRFENRASVTKGDLIELLPWLQETRTAFGEGLTCATGLLRGLGLRVPALRLPAEFAASVPTEREVRFLGFGYFSSRRYLRSGDATRAEVLRGSRRAEIYDQAAARRVLKRYAPLGLAKLATKFRYPSLTEFSEIERAAWSEDFDGRPSWVDEDVYRRGFISDSPPSREELLGHAFFFSATTDLGFREAVDLVFRFPGLGPTLDWPLESVDTASVDAVDVKLMTRLMGRGSRYRSNKFDGVGQKELLRRLITPYELMIGAENAGVTVAEAHSRLARFEVLGTKLPENPDGLELRELSTLEFKLVTTKGHGFRHDPPVPIEGPIPGLKLLRTAREERMTIGEIWEVMEGLHGLGFVAAIETPPEHLVGFVPEELDMDVASTLRPTRAGLSLCHASYRATASVGYLSDLASQWAPWVLGDEGLPAKLEALRRDFGEHVLTFEQCVMLAALEHDEDLSEHDYLGSLVQMAAEANITLGEMVRRAEFFAPVLAIDGIVRPLVPAEWKDVDIVPNWEWLLALGLAHVAGARAKVPNPTAANAPDGTIRVTAAPPRSVKDALSGR